MGGDNVQVLSFEGKEVTPDVSAKTISKNIRKRIRSKGKSGKMKEQKYNTDKYKRGDKNDTKVLASLIWVNW